MSLTEPNNAFALPLTDVSNGSSQFPWIHVNWHAAVQVSGTFVNVKIVEFNRAGFCLVGDIAYMNGKTLSLRINVRNPINRSEQQSVSCEASVISSVLTRAGFRTDVAIKSIASAHQEMLNSWLKIHAAARM